MELDERELAQRHGRELATYSTAAATGDSSVETMWPRLYTDAATSVGAARRRGRVILVSIASAVAAACATVMLAVLSAGGLTVLEGIGPVRQNVVSSSVTVRETDGETAGRIPLSSNAHDPRLAWTHPTALFAWSRTDDPRAIDVLVASHGAASCWQTTATASKTGDGYRIEATTGLSTARFFRSALELSRGFEKGCAGYISCVPASGVDFYLPSCRGAGEAISETDSVNGSMPKMAGPEPMRGVQVRADYDVVRLRVRLPEPISDSAIVTGAIDNEAATWMDEADAWAGDWRAKQTVNKRMD